MRLAYICSDPGVPVFGRKGCSIHVQEVIRALRGEGADVELFAARMDGEPPLDLESVPVYRLPNAAKGDLRAREKAALAANDTLREMLRSRGPFDLVYERYGLWGHAGMEYAAEASIPGILEVNAPLIEEQARHRGLADRAAAEKVAERAFAAATALVAVSEEVAAHLECFPVARGRIHVIPNGVDPARFPDGLEPSLSRRAGTFTVGFVGTLKPWHGLSTLVEAFAILHGRDPTYRLLIVGDGPERGRLLGELRVRGEALPGAAQFTGAVSHEAIPGLLASMDVAVAPYPALPDFYFSPLKVYEYLATGRAVVASRIGQLARLIRHGTHGLLYPPGDAAALAAAVAGLRHDPHLRCWLGQLGRRHVLQHHSWAAVARRILRLARCEVPLAACHVQGEC